MRALSCLAAENYALQMGRNGLERNAFNYSHVSALVSRIRAFMDDERFKTIVNPDGGAPVQTPLSMERESANLTNDIFGKAKFEKHDLNVHIVDLSRLAPDLMPFVLGSLLEMLASQLFVRGPGQTHPTFLILEEAHHYLRQLPGTDDGAGQMRAYERLAKEGRKFGLSLLVSTQRPSELSPTVLAQCGTWAVFRLRDANFEFQSGSDAVHRLKSVCVGRLRMLVQIDEAGRDDQVFRVDFQLASQRTRGDGGDLPAVDADAAHGVEAGFGIHHASVLENNIVSLRDEERRKK